MNNSDAKGHRARLRQRFLNNGLEGLHDYEAVELLLTYAIPRKDVKPIAKKLILKYNNIAGLVDAPIEELVQFEGISENSAALMHIIKDFCGVYLADKMKKKDVLSSPEAVVDFARMNLIGLKEEVFMVIYVNVKNHVIDYEITASGTVDKAFIYPRNILKQALSLHASGLILIHNHPTGICEPSENDVRLTSEMKNAGQAMHLHLLDHIIVGKSGHYSFVKHGLL